MLLFSWKKICKNSDGRVGTIFRILDMLVNDRLPLNKFDPIYKYHSKDYSGLSFLVNPHDLLKNAYKYTTKEIIQYVALASYRRYSDYLSNKTTTIDLLETPISEATIKENRLLRLEGTIVYFLYEEVTKEKN